MNRKEIKISVLECEPNELNDKDSELLKAALLACSGSYAPFSGFNVGCALRLASGKIVTGSNQENTAYPSGLCAERVAMFYANSQYPDDPIIEILVTSSINGVQNTESIYPCGSCRQSLLQSEIRFANNIRVMMAGSAIVKAVNSIKDLLPLSFDLDNYK